LQSASGRQHSQLWTCTLLLLETSQQAVPCSGIAVDQFSCGYLELCGAFLVMHNLSGVLYKAALLASAYSMNCFAADRVMAMVQWPAMLHDGDAVDRSWLLSRMSGACFCPSAFCGSYGLQQRRFVTCWVFWKSWHVFAVKCAAWLDQLSAAA
jgi:hypothetical protein